MNRTNAIAKLVIRKVRALGGRDYERLAVHHALNSYADGHSAFRSVHRGVGLAGECAAQADAR